jgi:hypothetical protein
LALPLTTIPENSDNLEPVLKYVEVRNALAADARQVVCVGDIFGCTHVILEIATSSKAGD